MKLIDPGLYCVDKVLFRGISAAASLKRAAGDNAQPVVRAFLRHFRRGLIEARFGWRRSPAGVLFRGISAAASLKLCFQRRLHSLKHLFRGISAAASLKRLKHTETLDLNPLFRGISAAASLKRWVAKIVIAHHECFPRHSRRSLIEALPGWEAGRP